MGTILAFLKSLPALLKSTGNIFSYFSKRKEKKREDQRLDALMDNDAYERDYPE